MKSNTNNNEDGGSLVDSQPSSKNRGLKVIGVGFPRTGTTSLEKALNLLGFRCYDFPILFNDHRHARLWLDALEGNAHNWDWNAMFGDYSATVDCPSTHVYKSLMKAYPDAKIILTVRDPESWYESVVETLLYPSHPKGDGGERDGETRGAAVNVGWDISRRKFAEDKQGMIEIYKQHIDDVKRSVPAEKLLVFEARQGWPPLCNFLGFPLPAVEFPHSLDRKDFQNYFDNLVNGICPENTLLNSTKL